MPTVRLEVTSPYGRKGTVRHVDDGPRFRRAVAGGHVTVVDDAPVSDVREDADEVSERSDTPDDGVFHVGGPWFEVVVGGEAVKVRGRDAADELYVELTDSPDDDLDESSDGRAFFTGGFGQTF